MPRDRKAKGKAKRTDREDGCRRWVHFFRPKPVSDMIIEKNPMEFRKRHKKLYIFWMISSMIVAFSMVAFLLAPIFYSR